MKTKKRHPARYVLLAVCLFIGMAAKAQDYTDYDYVELFNNLPTMNGTISGNYLATDWKDAPLNTDGYLKTNITGQSGGRNSTFTLTSSVNFTKKLVVEFDWYPVSYTGGSGDEGQISFRGGTNNNSIFFTVYNLRGSNNIGFAAGPLTGSKAESVNAAYRNSLTDAPLSKWYHIKAEIYAGQRICFTVTGEDDYNKQFMLPLPEDFSQTGISNIYFNASRNGSNITWNTMIDNIGIRIADADAEVAATHVTVISEFDMIAADGGTAVLSASVDPFNASDHAIIWSVDNENLASVAAGYPSWTATLTGLNAGSGEVVVTATSATAGILGTKTITVSADPILLTGITVSGAQEVSVNSNITLTTSVLPGNASDKSVVWSSSDENIAVVDPATGIVTGKAAGEVTITATAADGGGVYGNHTVTVNFTSITSINLQGARRIFYTENPAEVPAFNLTSTIAPTDASVKTLNWVSQDPAIATVVDGQVTLAGGFGKTAIVAQSTDGSGVNGYYYMEVAAENPYDVFSDFESGTSPFSGSTSSFQESRTLYWSVSNQSGGRSQTFSLSDAIAGGVVNLKFDWYASTVVSYPNSGILSIQDNASGTANMIISFGFANTPDEETQRFRYFMGNYTTADAEAPLGLGIHLQDITALDSWYTLDITIDYLQDKCSFSITNRDNPSMTQTITDIALSPVNPPEANVKSLFINGLRTSGKNITITSAIDNFSYKILNTELPTYEVKGLSIDGLDKVAPGGKIMLYPRIQPGNAINKNVIWQSMDPAVATVEIDEKGRAVVTGVSNGTAVIKAVSDENDEIFAEKTIAVEEIVLPQRQLERLDRGLVAVKTDDGVFLSWRLFATDPVGIRFNLYKNNDTEPVNAEPLGASYTDFVDPDGSESDQYSVAALVNEAEINRSRKVNVWSNQYLSIPVEMPTTGHLPDGSPYTNYTIYDGSTADLDGDGQYEIIFLWGPSNMQDNSNSGSTGNVFIDAYKLDGTKMWGAGKYIDLGSNIRAGAHYSPFLVYDFDGDGKAEIIIKTADGTIDATGQMIGEDIVYANTDGFILEGDEYLSVFEGATGKVLASEPYDPPRGNVQDWGDGIGNRADRFIAAVAYLDGVHPSAVMCRGYYTRTTLCAWDWDGKNLNRRWLFDTNLEGYEIYKGQGNHNMSVADVDMDGKDEIIYGSLTINDDGTPMYTTGLGHGDAMHVGKFDATRPGLQMVGVHENPFPYGLEMHDLMTGDLVWSVVASGDIGRGLTADIDPEYDGSESWSSGGLGTYSVDGVKLAGSISSVNMAIHWDGETGRELFDGGSNPSVTKITASEGSGSNLRSYSSRNLITFSGASTNGGSKNNPCLQADIFGDWREELILRASNNSELRIYTTVTPTEHTGAGAVPESGIPTLMHDDTYRMAIAWQNGGYNQPPHTGFFLGYNMPEVERKEGAAISVTLDPNGGTFDDQTTDNKVISVVSGEYFEIPGIFRNGIEFLGWFLSDGTEYSPTGLYTEDITLKAVWLVPVEDIRFDKTVVTIEVGQTEELIATVLPEDAFNKNVTWLSDNGTIASVDENGTVTGLAVGTTVIIVTTEDGNFSAYCAVTVIPAAIPATGVSLNKMEMSVEIGTSEQLTATILPSDASNQAVSWSSDDPAIATVDENGVVTGVETGTVAITVTTESGGITATCMVTVTPAPIAVTGISLDQTVLTLEVGESKGLIAAILPEDATNKEVVWSSYNSEVAIVDENGMVTAVEVGTTVMIVMTTDGNHAAYCVVTVIPATVSVTDLSLNKTEMSIKVGAGEQLTATVTPDDATNQAVTWSSADVSIAEVNNAGMVTGVKAGTTTITVTTEDGGKTAVCTVTVEGTTGFETPVKPLATVYPNPTNGNFTVNFESQDNHRVIITNLTGKVLSQEIITNQVEQMDISSYPAGIYLLIIDNGTERTTIKIVKQ